MKIAISLFLTFFSLATVAQSHYVEVKQEFLSSRADFGTFEVSTHQATLDSSLSESLKSNVLQSSGPYAITNMSEIQTLIEAQKANVYPDMTLALNMFEGQDNLNISIDRIRTKMGRDILRGTVDSFPGSQVKLVVYQGQMTGRITLSTDKKVMVIRSVNGGITANYEIDTSDITFD